jgi:hypothetical protein
VLFLSRDGPQSEKIGMARTLKVYNRAKLSWEVEENYGHYDEYESRTKKATKKFKYGDDREWMTC